MSNNTQGQPTFRAPAHACDSHFHVFGPAERYPYTTGLRYPPPLAPLDEFLDQCRTLGIERMVFVQPSAYGRDNTCMLDAMREMRERLGAKYNSTVRGIVDIDEDIPDSELEALNALGVRGVRINVSPVKPLEPGFAATMLKRIQRFDARLSEIGWQLDFLGPGWLTRELMPTFRTLRVPFTVAHMGMFLAKDGIEQPGFQELLDLLRSGEGRCWIKFTGVYRMSAAPRFADAAPFAQAIIEAAPDRIIWGSDFPHVSFADKTSSLELFNLLGEWAPDDETRQKILVENPRVLFGFG